MLEKHKLLEILLVDKPPGMTSFDVIRALRRQTGYRKFGHAGTLDPSASGLLVLGVGAGTKKLAMYQKQDKTYEAVIYLGSQTSTGDGDGEVINTVPLVEVHEEEIKRAVQSLQGTHKLPVSAYSAIKQNGVPLYKKARAAAKRGEVLQDVPYRTMTVYEAVYQGTRRYGNHLLTSCTFDVSSGTYIRSLAEYLGKTLGYPAHLDSLRRTRVGDFSINEAYQLNDIATNDTN